MNNLESFLKIDNLYKFISILGIILFIAPSILGNRLEKLQIEALKLQSESKIVKESAKSLNNKVKKFEKDFIKIENKIKISHINLYKLCEEKYKLLSKQKENISLLEKKLIDKKLKDLNKRINSIIQKNRKNFDIMNYYNSQNNENYKSAIEKQKLAENLLIKAKTTEIELNNYMKDLYKEEISKIIGIALIILGVILWYFKIQIYIDKEIKSQSKTQ